MARPLSYARWDALSVTSSSDAAASDDDAPPAGPPPLLDVPERPYAPPPHARRARWSRDAGLDMLGHESFLGKVSRQGGRLKLAALRLVEEAAELTFAVQGELDAEVRWTADEAGEAVIPERPCVTVLFLANARPVHVVVAVAPHDGVSESVIPPTSEYVHSVVGADDVCELSFAGGAVCKVGSTAEWCPALRELRVRLCLDSLPADPRVQPSRPFTPYIWYTLGILARKRGWRTALTDDRLVAREELAPNELMRDDDWVSWDDDNE